MALCETFVVGRRRLNKVRLLFSSSKKVLNLVLQTLQPLEMKHYTIYVHHTHAIHIDLTE